MYAHTSEAVDFEAHKGKRIAILGGAHAWTWVGGRGILMR